VHVLRLCSVFEAPPGALGRRAVRFDTIGGMQNHTASLTRELDRIGVRQTVITTRPPTAAAEEPLGRAAQDRAGAYDWTQLARRVLDVYRGVRDDAGAASGTRQRACA